MRNDLCMFVEGTVAGGRGVEKDVVNLAFHEFFKRRQYLPVEE